MTEQEKITILATELMGWRIVPIFKRIKEERVQVGFHYYDGETEIEEGWNPYQDENHGRQVIEKLMEGGKMDAVLDKFVEKFQCKYSLLQATLPERMEAVFDILPEKK